MNGAGARQRSVRTAGAMHRRSKSGPRSPSVARTGMTDCHTSGILPEPDQVPMLVPKPGSILWRFAGDARLVATGPYAILLQVAHPTVGAGVSEHSGFRADPWGRLLRTLDYSYAMVYGGPLLAAEMGRRIRGLHEQIKGVRPDGKAYHALEPEAYAWVHATLADSIVRGQELLGSPMSLEEAEELLAGWRRIGELVGVRGRDLPGSWPEFGDYFERMVEGRLERTRAVEEVLESLASPARPPLRLLSDAAWQVLRIPALREIELITVGLLPELLRERFGLRWGRSQELRLRALGATSRAATPLLPARLRNVGPSYLRWRRQAIASAERGFSNESAQPASGA
jgi:uncharacterized protein (DUF2236 family)